MELVLFEGEGILGEAVEKVVGEDDKGIFEGGMGLVGVLEVEGLSVLGIELGDVEFSLLEVGLEEGVMMPVMEVTGGEVAEDVFNGEGVEGSLGEECPEFFQEVVGETTRTPTEFEDVDGMGGI